MPRRISTIDFILPALVMLPVLIIQEVIPLGLLTVLIMWITGKITGSIINWNLMIHIISIVLLGYYFLNTFIRTRHVSAKKYSLFLVKAATKRPNLRHPIVNDDDINDTPSIRVSKKMARSKIQLQSAAISGLIVWSVTFFVWLYSARSLWPQNFSCLDCSTFMFGLKSIMVGSIKDSLEAIGIDMSGMKSNSRYVTMISFIANLMFATLLISNIKKYLSLRKRYRYVLRQYALTS